MLIPKRMSLFAVSVWCPSIVVFSIVCIGSLIQTIHDDRIDKENDISISDAYGEEQRRLLLEEAKRKAMKALPTPSNVVDVQWMSAR